VAKPLRRVGRAPTNRRSLLLRTREPRPAVAVSVRRAPAAGRRGGARSRGRRGPNRLPRLGHSRDRQSQLPFVASQPRGLAGTASASDVGEARRAGARARGGQRLSRDARRFSSAQYRATPSRVTSRCGPIRARAAESDGIDERPGGAGSRSSGSARTVRGRLPAPRARFDVGTAGERLRERAEPHARGEMPGHLSSVQDGRRCRGSRAIRANWAGARRRREPRGRFLALSGRGSTGRCRVPRIGPVRNRADDAGPTALPGELVDGSLPRAMDCCARPPNGRLVISNSP